MLEQGEEEVIENYFAVARDVRDELPTSNTVHYLCRTIYTWIFPTIQGLFRKLQDI